MHSTVASITTNYSKLHLKFKPCYSICNTLQLVKEMDNRICGTGSDLSVGHMQHGGQSSIVVQFDHYTFHACLAEPCDHKYPSILGSSLNLIPIVSEKLRNKASDTY
jgi:hypothetical protein